MQRGLAQGKKSAEMNLSKQFRLRDPEMTLTGFQPGYDGTFKASEAKGIQAAINWDQQNNMTYELTVPIQSFFASNLKTIKDNPIIGIRIDVNALSLSGEGGQGPGMRGNSAGGGQGPGGAGNGPGGGKNSGSGGGPGGRMGERPESQDSRGTGALSSPTAIKFKIRLNGLVKSE
jgi:hypothetical protein